MGSSWFIDPEKGEALSFDSSRVWILGHGILLFSIPVHKVFFSTPGLNHFTQVFLLRHRPYSIFLLNLPHGSG